eukprot:TRINITY_DN1960_c0_g3_i2.p1 TRINITY_DN1960_c0_g3~~TRINITY_DN1960_c0_g3_i2.p1  ORF type:complete len:1499 (-),score=349.94 TRINITY_DN1960_c0_g3_i2:36-4532(-)
MIAFMDGLSQTGLLDCVTYSIGLSGSAWCPLLWSTALNRGDYNPFHTRSADDGFHDPWREGVRFDPQSPHAYAELHRMLCRTSQRETFGARAVEAAVPGVHGKTADAIAEIFLPGCARKLSEEERQKQRESGTRGADREDGPRSVIKIYAALLGRTFCDEESTNAKFSDCADRLLKGDCPIPMCALIADDDSCNDNTTAWSWVDFTPFVVRKDAEFLKPTEQLEDATIPELMSTCASAFAFTWGYIMPSLQEVLPSSVQRFLLPNDAWCHQKRAFCDWLFKGYGSTTGYDSDVGRMRDGGIDVNMPFQALKGRDVDIAIMMECSAGYKGCENLALAVQKGCLTIRREDQHLINEPFAPQECCRIFHPGRVGDPVIIYLRGHTLLSTALLDYTNEELHGLLESVRQVVLSSADTIKWAIRTWAASGGNGVYMPSATPSLSVPRSLPSQEPISGLAVRQRLKQFFRHKYERLSVLGGGGRCFAELFVKVSLSHESERGLEHNVGLRELWDVAERRGLSRVVIEASAGLGKSTLAKYLARIQGDPGWRSHFSAVIVLPLQHVDPEAPPQSAEAALADPVGVRDEAVAAFVRARPERVLWVFDSFDEVEHIAAGNKFRRWLNALIEGRIEWAPHALIMSRKERDATFVGALHTELEEWTDKEMERYIDRFFHGKRPADKARALALLQENPTLRAFARTPLICELVCTVHSRAPDSAAPPAEAGAVVTLKALIATLVTWLWDRANDKLASAGNPRLAKREIDEAEARLCTVALAARCGIGGGTFFELDVTDPVDLRIYSSGIVRQFAVADEVNRAPSKKRCEFVHRMLLEYFAAWAVWGAHVRLSENGSKRQKEKETGKLSASLEKAVTLAPEERLMMVMLAGFAKEGDWKPVFTQVCNKLLERYARRGPEFEKQMSREGTRYAVREQWRNSIGVNIAIEVATVLGEEATHQFISAMCPTIAKIGGIVEAVPLLGRWVASPRTRYRFAPWIFRLMVEPAARYGNLLLLAHVIERAGGHSELDMALLEAHLARQQAAIELLVSKGAGRLSVQVPARLGHVEGVKQLLEESSYDRAMVSSAANAALARNQVHVVDMLLGYVGADRMLSQAVVVGAGSCVQRLARTLQAIDLSSCADKMRADMLLILARSAGNNLRTLNLNNCFRVNEYSLLQVARCCNRLTSLDVSGCVNVSDQCLAELARNCALSLKVLAAARCPRVTGVGAGAIASTCSALATLDLSCCARLGDDAFSVRPVLAAAAVGKLASLSLRGCALLTDAGVRAAMCACPLLHCLDLACCPHLTDAALYFVASSNCGRSNATAEVPEDLCNTRAQRARWRSGGQLAVLDVSGCVGVTDEGVCAVALSCAALEVLRLRGCRVGDVALCVLAGENAPASLRKVDLRGCAGVSAEAVCALAQRRESLLRVDARGCAGVRAADLPTGLAGKVKAGPLPIAKGKKKKKSKAKEKNAKKGKEKELKGKAPEQQNEEDTEKEKGKEKEKEEGDVL